MLAEGVCSMFINVRQRAVIRVPDTHHNAYLYFFKIGVYCHSQY
jgi:hypothetical protein